MEDIKKINPALLLIISIVVFTISFLGAPYIFAQSQIYYCKSKTDTTTNPDIRYFACSTDSSFTNSQVSQNNAATFCEISSELLWCQQISVATMIKNTLGNYYCPGGWAYSPSPGNPSSDFSCSTPPPQQNAFDFSLSNGGTRSVRQGELVTNTVTAEIKSGTSIPVSFNIYQLPASSTASFSPTSSCAPSETCTVTITINTDPSTPPGVYPVIVMGTSEIPSPSFPDQYATALGYCNGVTTSFYAKMSINNRYSSEASFSRTSFTKSCPTCDLDSAPDNFTVPANTILTKGGFGNITYTNPNCPAVPGDPYGPGIGSATYSVTVGGLEVDPAVTYSWDYAI